MENKLDLCKTRRLRLQGGVRTPICGTSSPSVGKAGGVEGTHRPAQRVGTFADDMVPASRLRMPSQPGLVTVQPREGRTLTQLCVATLVHTVP